ncbi:2-amino-4-hydroxy-6-hydroxymethyldihydropteridine pyrophosphokinase [Rhodococcus sp. Leaf7]|uniref:2-amino-4-hydroxy-6- hydroxymethyldihydropteridine diphosphokinase n=1 Tax=unclassified Rhodococcus (in: high G+C Gram-positive bacteria) TaxID=192944 RepID=UPI0006F315DA|nr:MULTISPECIES: 2-amino-4-hydroxy-6-hydroxymethyldihydropteridine diphosphokinase [unclassified Rhodococcus (in: high G+C Gram-positive bacteria)]KQU07412.1 2-amino-4-hydroxy-6-hydroxymethyldihydropteridine pyrophosphokinase [Rhodococcus sp. Leaf7]KQU42932.1 2-amino-4-hydroxy-6-hydroxymethyldihydropteridine pyrophosphokinase [Rhodococcus sp. Leaf247]
MSRAVLSIGSNIGDRESHLRGVVDSLGDAVVGVSSLYSTAPWGGIDQQDFLNAVVVVDDPDLDCWGWLLAGQELERIAHRERVVRWGPRTVDVDVIVCDDVCSDDPELILPHPRAHERAFVLVPWLDVEPDATLGDTPVRELLEKLPESERVGVHPTDLRLT